MQQQQGSTSIVLVGIVTTVVGILLGFGAASLLQPEAKTSTQTATTVTPAADTKPAAQRASLVGLLREHADLLAQAARNQYDNSLDLAAAATQLDANSNSLADAIGAVYGDSGRVDFYAAWKAQVGYLLDYAAATKKGDKTAAATATASQASGAAKLASELTSLDSSLPQSALNDYFSKVATLDRAGVDAYAVKDYTGSYAQQHAAGTQLGAVGDVLATAMVASHPEKF